MRLLLLTLVHLLGASGVVAEEMLHLSLAGNVLRAVGGTPKLYDPLIIPSYPMLMPGRVPDLELNLRALTKQNLQTFVDVYSSLFTWSPGLTLLPRWRPPRQRKTQSRSQMSTTPWASFTLQLRKASQ
jgi:hypothetical protein